MAINGQAKEGLDSWLTFSAYEAIVKSGDYTLARPSTPTADPKPFLEVVNKAGERDGNALISLDDRQIETRFERYACDDSQEPSLRVNYKDLDESREVTLEVSTRELRLSIKNRYPGSIVPKSDLPQGMLEAPGATITFLHKDDLRRLKQTGRGRVRRHNFTFKLRGVEEKTFFYRPVRDNFLFNDPSSREPIRVKTVPEVPLKELPYVSADTAALIAKQLDPYIEIGSLDFYKPVAIIPTHPLSKEIAHLIADALYPKTE